MVRGKQAGYLVLGAVFILGVVSGGGIAFAWTQESHAAMVREGKVFEGKRLKALSRKLDLDRDQESRVATILANDADESQTLGHDVVQRCGQRLRDHKTRVDDEIRTTLRPDQQRRFDRLVDERRHKAWVRGL
jgi:hypothetical protein